MTFAWPFGGRHAMLKPGGVPLLTTNGIVKTGRYLDRDSWGEYWHLTQQGATSLFEENFAGAFEVEGYGNVLSAVAFLHGLASSELTPEELEPRRSRLRRDRRRASDPIGSDCLDGPHRAIGSATMSAPVPVDHGPLRFSIQNKGVPSAPSSTPAFNCPLLTICSIVLSLSTDRPTMTMLPGGRSRM